MPAPANDNWASASVISGASGQTSGTNISATAEAGEPANNGKTVWYAWTAPADGLIWFNTLFNGTIGAVSNPVQTVLQAFTGSAVNALTEVGYLHPSVTWKTRYANWDFGSSVAFYVNNGTTYYIRVDGVAAGEGNFALTWKPYANLFLGSCSGCPPRIGNGTCLGTIEIPDCTVVNSSTSFGSFAAGSYVVAYCQGAFRHVTSRDSWIISQATTTGPGPYINVKYNDLGTPTQLALRNLDTGSPSAGFFSQAETEIKNICAFAPFRHAGGDISMVFQDSPATDNANGSPNPIFGLYQFNPDLVIQSACASWTTAGSVASCSFTILNNNIAEWDNVTATLDTAGGISSSSTTTGITIAAGTTTTFSIASFDCSTTNVTATLRLSCADFPADVVLNVFLGPVLQLSLQTYSNSVCGLAPPNNRPICNVLMRLQNVGYWQFVHNITGTFSIDSGVQSVSNIFSTCAPGGWPLTWSYTADLACVTGITGVNTFGVNYALRIGVPQNCTVTVVANDSTGHTSATATLPLTIPA